MGRRTWPDWIKRVPAFAQMSGAHIEKIVQSMLDQKILWDDQGILSISDKGENIYGRKHFQALLSVFLSPPLFLVMHGRQELGFVDDRTFMCKQSGDQVLLLGGHAWKVKYIDWSHRTAYVDTSEGQGRSLWKGTGQSLGFSLCQAIARVLMDDQIDKMWSRRAMNRLSELRQNFWWLKRGHTTVVSNDKDTHDWWTFGGTGANASLAAGLSRRLGIRISHDPLKLCIPQLQKPQILNDAISYVQSQNPMDLLPEVDDSALEVLKFSECLPKEMAIHILQMRLRDADSLAKILSQTVRYVSSKEANSSHKE